MKQIWASHHPTKDTSCILYSRMYKKAREHNEELAQTSQHFPHLQPLTIQVRVSGHGSNNCSEPHVRPRWELPAGTSVVPEVHNSYEITGTLQHIYKQLYLNSWTILVSYLSARVIGFSLALCCKIEGRSSFTLPSSSASQFQTISKLTYAHANTLPSSSTICSLIL